jgi:hypothetical protein
MRTQRLRIPCPRALPAALILATLLACSAEQEAAEARATPSIGAAPSSPSPVARLLESDEAVFGIRPAELTSAEGARMVQALPEGDLVFASLESGPWDLPGLQAYMQGVRDAARAASIEPFPMFLRIPPIHEVGADKTRANVSEALAAGVDGGIIFPHIMSRAEAEVALSTLGQDGWPLNPTGRLVPIIMIEDKASVENAREIASTPGVHMVFLGPRSLTSAYNEDAAAVENAIQSVLAVCKELDVACGITAGVDDIGTRVQQGFKFVMVREPAELAAGRAAAGRTN